MPRPAGVLSLALTLAIAAPAAGSENLGSGASDEERKDDSAEAAKPESKPESVPAEAVQKAPEAKPAPAAEKKPTGKDYVPATQSFSVDLGGAVNLLGGYAYPKIALKGTPDDGFYAHGLGAGFKLHWDFPAQGVDWRLGLDGTLPGWAGLEATVGIRKDLGPWTNPRVIMRGAGGVEFMCGGGDQGTIFLIPVIVGKGEAFIEATVVENVLSIGAGFELGLKYGVPLGVGFDFGTFIRTELWF